MFKPIATKSGLQLYSQLAILRRNLQLLVTRYENPEGTSEGFTSEPLPANGCAILPARVMMRKARRSGQVGYSCNRISSRHLLNDGESED
jgi:hypothetical protein